MTRFRIGARVLKTTLAVILAIFFAQLLGLEERLSLAALVALLTVQKTFYHSLRQSMATLGAVLLGGLLGTGFGYLFGITPLAYGIVTLLGILICHKLNWQNQTVLTTLTAIGTIFSGAASLGFHSLLQILTALIGGGCALLVNYLFLPNRRKELNNRIQRVENGLRQEIDTVIKEIEQPGSYAKEFKGQYTRLKQEIEEGLEEAGLLWEEQRFAISREISSNYYSQLFYFFNSQLESLEEMYRLARRMPQHVPYSFYLVKVLKIIQKIQARKRIGKKCSYSVFERAMANMDERFAALELPRNREEYIGRAALLHLFQEIKGYHRRIIELPEFIW